MTVLPSRRRSKVLKMDFENIPERATKLKRNIEDKLKEYRRVLKISEKPDRDEFVMSAKVTTIGMLLIGFIGFLFYMGSNLIPQFFSDGEQASQGILLLAGTSSTLKALAEGKR